MKKYFLLVCLSIFVLSCDKDDESNSVVLGCTDPEAENFNSNADTDNGTCQYSLVGEWDVSSYIYGTQEIMDSYSYLYIDFFSNGTYNTWGQTTAGVNLDVYGEFSIGGDNNSLLYMENTQGDATVLQIMELDSSFISMEGVEGFDGQYVSIEAYKL